MNDFSKNNKQDLTAKVAKSIVGAAPFLGQFLCQIVDEVIPNQKLDRLIQFVKILDKKLSELKKEFLEQVMRSENGADFLEEGLRQASRALSDERREYIASLVANGFSSKIINYNELKHLLRILSEINDIEIIWLRFYSSRNFGEAQEFREKHKAILEWIPVTIGATQDVKERAALQESYIQHLVQLGLLEHQYDSGGLRLDATPEDILTPKDQKITNLGQLILKQIGLVE